MSTHNVSFPAEIPKEDHIIMVKKIILSGVMLTLGLLYPKITCKAFLFT